MLKTKGVRNRKQTTATLEELEARILYSADLLPEPDTSSGGIECVEIVSEDQPADAEAPAANILMLDSAGDQHAAPDNPAASSSDRTPATRHEIIVVDANVPDPALLIDSLLDTSDSQFELIQLDADRDPLDQLLEVLKSGQSIDAIHLVSHASDAALQLGNTTLNTANIADYREQFKALAGILSPDADLLIYGCDLAASNQGQAMMDLIGLWTGADVTASIDATGSENLGGNWVLEYSKGVIESDSLEISETSGWSGLLANTAPVSTLPVLNGTEDQNLVINWSNLNISDADSSITANTGILITTLPNLGTLEYRVDGTWIDVGTGQIITKAQVDAGNLRYVPLPDSNSSKDTIQFSLKPVQSASLNVDNPGAEEDDLVSVVLDLLSSSWTVSGNAGTYDDSNPGDFNNSSDQSFYLNAGSSLGQTTAYAFSTSLNYQLSMEAGWRNGDVSPQFTVQLKAGSTVIGTATEADLTLLEGGYASLVLNVSGAGFAAANGNALKIELSGNLGQAHLDNITLKSIDPATAIGPESAASINLTAIDDGASGSVALDHYAVLEGDLLTATHSLTDPDGISGAIMFQWYRDGVAISGATGSTYTARTEDISTSVTARASYTDLDGFSVSVDSPAANVTEAFWLDTFDLDVYDNNDGTLTFTDSWLEAGDDAKADKGNLSIKSGELKVSGGDITLTREFDLSGTSSATLSLDYFREALEVDDVVNIRLSADNGVSWTTVISIAGSSASSTDAGYTRISTDLTGLSSGPTLIQLDIVNFGEGNDKLYVDNLKITRHFVNNAPVAVIGPDQTLDEGSDLVVDASLSSDADGDSLIYLWDLDGDGLYNDASGSTVNVGWAELATLGAAGNSTMNFSVRVDDGFGGVSYATTQAEFTNVAPDIITSGAYLVDENASNVLQVDASDAGGDSLTYGLGGADAGRFSINSTTGLITLPTPLNYESTQDAGLDGTYDLILYVTDDATTSQSTITLTVVNMNEAPGGAVVIDNTTPAEGDILTASETITDEDGRDGSTVIQYQWLRDGTVISGGTSSTYTVTASDIGHRLSALASYTDLAGFTNQLVSAQTGVITGSNQPPEAYDDSYTTYFETTLNVGAAAGVAANDFEPNGDVLTVIDYSQPANGSVVLNKDGSFSYIPDSAFSGTDSFSYTIIEPIAAPPATPVYDVNMNNDGAFPSLNYVDGVDAEAVAFDGVAAIELTDPSYSNAFSISLWFNIADASGATWQYLYSHGDSFSSNSINISLIEENTTTGGPSATGVLRTVIFDSNDSATSAARQALDIDISDHTLADGQWHQYTATVASGVGTKVYIDGVELASSLNGGDAIDPAGNAVIGNRYDMAGNRFYANALDQFSVFGEALDPAKVSLLAGSQTSATVNITVLPNQSPQLASATVGSVNEDTQLTLTFAQLVTALSASDVDGSVTTLDVTSVDSGSLLIGSSPGSAVAWSAGSVHEVSTGQSIFWTPDANANGILSAFKVQAIDDRGATSSSVDASVNVSAVNDAPSLTNVNLFDGFEDNTRTITLYDLLYESDQADIDGTVTAFKVDNLSGGTLLIGNSLATATAWASGSNDIIDATRQAYWTPPANANGTLAAFEVFAVDNSGANSILAVDVTINVQAVNDAPTLTTISNPIGVEDTVEAVSFSDLVSRGNEADLDGTVAAFIVTNVLEGTLAIGVDLASATPWVSGTNDIIDAGHSAFWTPLANEYDVLAPSNAFTVIAVDNLGLGSAQNVNVPIFLWGVNDLPELDPFSAPVASTAVNTEVEITMSELQTLSNARDIENALTGFAVTSVHNGSLRIGSSSANATAWNASSNYMITGSLKAYWTPDAGLSGNLAAFDVKATDFWAFSTSTSVNTETAFINVGVPNNAPTLTTFTTPLVQSLGSSAVNLTFSDLLWASDATDSDGTVVGFIVKDVPNGSLTINGSVWSATTNHQINATSTVNWTPPVSQYGSMQALSLVALDDDGMESATAVSVSIEVAVPNAAPTFTSTTYSQQENTTAAIQLLATDDTTTALTYLIVAGADSALFSLTSDGWLSFIHAPDYELPADANQDNAYEVTVQVTDGDGASVSQPLVITVTNVNEAPTFATTSYSQTENSASVIQILANDAEDVASTLSFSIAGGADSALFHLNSSGHLSFKTAPDYEQPGDANRNNQYEVTVQVTDGDGASVSQSLLVTVTNLEEAPKITWSATAPRYIEDSSLKLDGISITEPDLQQVTVTLRLDNPALGSLVSGNALQASASGSIWQHSGSSSDVSAALADLYFVPAADVNADVLLHLAISDGTSSIEATRIITGVSVPDSPQVTRVLSDNGLTLSITPSSKDAGEVQFFKIVAVENGTLSTASGNIIEAGSFVSSTDATNLVFKPDSVLAGKIIVQASPDGIAVSGQSELVSTTMPGLAAQEQTTQTIAIEKQTQSTINLPEVSASDSPKQINEPLSDTNNSESGARKTEAAFAFVPPEENRLEAPDSTSKGDDVATQHALLVPYDHSEAALERNDARPEVIELARIEAAELMKIMDREPALEISPMVQDSYKNLLAAFTEMTQQQTLEYSGVKGSVGSAATVATGLSVGYIVWLIRGGMLLSSVMFTMPAWQIADPLPLLSSAKKNEDEENDESLQDIIARKKKTSFDSRSKETDKNGVNEAHTEIEA